MKTVIRWIYCCRNVCIRNNNISVLINGYMVCITIGYIYFFHGIFYFFAVFKLRQLSKSISPSVVFI